MKKPFLSVLVVMILFPFSSVALELVERVFEGNSQKRSFVEARKEIFKQAVEDTSIELIKEIIGEEKFSRNREKIYHRVIKNSGKYLSYIKSGKAKKAEDGNILMAVTMKFSLDDLQSLLLKNGLMYESDGAPVVLPMVVYADRVHLQSYRWWQKKDKKKAFLQRQQQILVQALRKEFSKKGFFTFLPGNYQLRSLIPRQFSVDHLKKEDYLFLGELLDTQLIIYGEYKVSRSRGVSEGYQIDLKLYGLHSGNGRTVAEIHRSLNTESGSFNVVVDKKLREEMGKVARDMTRQVLDTWQKGTFGSSLLQVSLKGAIPYVMQKAFKKAIKSQLRSVKNVRERFFSAHQVSFEMDVSKGLEDMKKDFSQLHFGRWRLSLVKAKKGHLSYRPVLQR